MMNAKGDRVPDGGVTQVCWSPDDRVLAASSAKGVVRAFMPVE